MGLKGALVGLAMALGLAVGVAEQQEPANKAVEQMAATKTDLYGDPLPEGALARLGTIRFRHDIRPQMVAFAAGGKVIASAGDGGYGVILWDAASGRPLHRLSSPLVLYSLAVSPDGKAVVTDNLVFIDVATGKETRRLLQGNQSSALVAFSPNGKTVAREAFGQRKIVLWDVETGTELRTLEMQADIIEKFAFSPDGRSLASSSMDKTIRIWDVATGKEMRKLPTVGHQFAQVAFSPNGKLLAVVGDLGIVQLWNPETGKLQREFRRHDLVIASVAFSPDGQQLALSERDNIGNSGIALFNTETAKELRRWPTTSMYSLVFSPDGKVLVSCGGGPSIHRWDPATGKEIDPTGGHAGPISSMRFGPDGKSVTTYDSSKTLEWDPGTSKVLRQLQAEDILPRDEKLRWLVKARSPDGKTVALSGFYVGEDFQAKFRPSILVWDAVAGKELFALLGNGKQPPTAAFSPDAKTLATAGDGTRLWDAATGKELRHLHKNPGISRLVFSPDGKSLADCGADNVIRLWDIATGKELRRWDMLQDRTTSVVFSPDGKLMLSLNDLRGSAGRNELRAWEAATGKLLFRFSAQGNGISAFIRARPFFSPTGRLVAIAEKGRRNVGNGDAEDNCTLRLLEMLTGREVRQINASQKDVSSLAFAPDGRTLASGGLDSTILLWDITGQFGKPHPPEPTAKELDSLWADLRGDAAKAERALWTLVFSPKQTMPFLTERLRLAAPAPPDTVAKLIAALDTDRFAERQKAVQALDALGESAEAALRKSLTGNLALEARQRVEQILTNRDKDTIRKIRAIEVLEQIGGTEARQVLKTMAEGAANPRLAEVARAAVIRLGGRP
jgi:WD40 repeat protein